MAKHAGSFDFILDTVSADHDLNAYLGLLKRDGNLTLVGAPEKPLPVASFPAAHAPPQALRLAHRRHRPRRRRCSISAASTASRATSR
jgi:hypothetical protein